MGRIGAGLAPLALVSLSHQVSMMAAFALLAGCYLLGALAMAPWILWGPEGRGRSLEVMCAEAGAK
jgi:hypothetical protein